MLFLQADADDIDTWMLDVLRIVSSVDVGHNEFSTQALVKKHKDVAEEIGSYRPVIEALHEQARTLPPEKANSEEVQPQLSNLELKSMVSAVPGDLRPLPVLCL